MSSPLPCEADRGPETLLGRYRLEVISGNDQCIEHHSENQAIARYSGKWKLIGSLGSGNFGHVLFHENTVSGEVRAVKEITGGKREWENREIECMILVEDFPDLFVSFHCWYEHNNSTFIAMDYLPLGNLAGWCFASEVRTEDIARDIIEQLLQALFVLHELGILHRDIKPENILIASDSPLRIKLADFGLAVKTTGAQLDEREASSWCVGTPDWASPEQKDCFIGPYTGKTDMWSAGCISHYVLTSHIPFLDRDAGNGPGVVEKYNYPSWPRVRREEFYNKVEHSIYDPIVVRGASSAANEFLNCLIVFNPDLRMSALNALSHRWINPTGMDPVELALIRGSEPLVDLFIRGGSPNPSPSRRLLVAAEKGRTEIVRRLLREVVYSRHEPGLQEACELGLQGCHSAVVDELWPHLSMYQRTCMTELHEKIAMFGTPKFLKKVIRYLKDNTQLRQGLNDSVIEVCAYDILFAEMMKAAARHGNIINLKILIKSSPHQEIPGGALLEAAKGGHLKVVKWILGCYRWVFADIGDPGGSLHGNIFSQALTYASSGGHMDVVKYFVPRRIAPNQRAIDKAVANNHTAIFQYFVNALRDIYKLSPEMGFKYIKTEAVGYCDLNTLKWCPNPSSLNENLKTHVGCASRLGHLDVVEWLLEEVPPIGINRAEEMHEGLIEASGAGHIDIVKFLCDKIGCVRIEIPLERAAAGGHVEVLEQLLSRRDKESSLSPALRAAQSSNQFVVLLKLDNLKT